MCMCVIENEDIFEERYEKNQQKINIFQNFLLRVCRSRSSVFNLHIFNNEIFMTFKF